MAIIIKDIFTQRVIIAAVIIMILFVMLILRSYYLQIVQYDSYSKKAFGNSVAFKATTPNRGRIFDRNGKILANNKLTYKMVIMPDKIKDIQQTLNKLKELKFITQQDVDKFNMKLKTSGNFKKVTIKNQLNTDEVARFLVFNDLDGVELEPYFYRVYYDSMANSHVIGYVFTMDKEDKKNYNSKNYKNAKLVGKRGIEKQYERILRGTQGVNRIERDASNRILSETTVKESISGKDIYLTIDINLQKKALKLMKNRRGSIVMMDVNNGNILTMVSSPSFDNNLFINGISDKDYKDLNNKDLPLFNRAIQGTYPPGSTIKPLIALVGLENKVITKHSKVFCKGYYKLPYYSRKFNDWKRSGHGHMDVVDSLAESCDVFFYDLANKMGIDMIYNGLKRFALDRKTDIDLPNEKSGILPSRAWKIIHKRKPWYDGETLITGIGQGFVSVTPLQLTLAIATIANGGKLFTPKILRNIEKNTQTSGDFTQIPINDIKNWNLVIEGMKKTIYGIKGTARRLNKKLKYTMAGKTGTSQVFGLDPEEQYLSEKYAEHLRDHALFVGFAPLKNPQVAISVIVENAGSGSTVAAPLAKKLLDLYFK